MTPNRGKFAGPLRILNVRALAREDLAILKTNERVQPRVKGFRDTHHRLARLVAAGLRIEEILRLTGYSYIRLSTLKQDPAFQELVAGYREKVDESYVRSIDEVHETAFSNMLRMERMVEDHLDKAEENDELIPLKTLFTGIGDRMDRFGYSKKTVQTNIVVDFAKKLEMTMARGGQATVIDSRPSVPEPHRLESPPQEGSSPGGSPEAPKSVAASAGIRRRM